MIILKILYLITAIEIIMIMYFMLKRLYLNIGDMKISNTYNSELKLKKNKLNKILIVTLTAIILTILCIFIFNTHALEVLKFIGDMMSVIKYKVVKLAT